MANKRSKRDRGAGSTGDPPEPAAGENSLREWLKSMALALVLFLVLRTFILNTFVIISGSMENTLLVGDLLLVNRAAIGTVIPGTSLRIPGYSDPRRGDVLVFDPPHEENMKLVKRLIGLPGDTLLMKDKVVFVNGQPLEEPYARHGGNGENFTDPIMAWQRPYLAPGVDPESYRPTRDDWGPLVIPPGHYFMLGDNRDASYDSRYWGLLEAWRLEGRAALIYFSYNRESLRAFPWLREVRWSRIGDRVTRPGRNRVMTSR
jgi:signal peptidase I